METRQPAARLVVSDMKYNELHIRLESRDDGAYDVVASGDAGEALGLFTLPFNDLELENFVLHVGRTRRGTRRLESPEMERAREFGGRLFDALFSSRVRDLYRDCSASARADGNGLRLKLSLGRAPALTDVPWEFLYDSPAFLSISQFTPVVRYLELPRARSPIAVELPLRILGVVSAPSGAVALDVEDERRKVEQALGKQLIERDLVEITWLEQATLRALQRELRRGPYHVFHFIGHGAYDPGLGESVLLFEDDEGRGRPVSGTQLGTMLADHTSLRLAILNACEGARTSRDDPFAGVAAALVQHELPAVIAMQFEITDRAAIIFAEELYAALVDGLAVDAALAESRKAIYGDGNDVEWGTPVLFMRVRDGRLFELPKPPPDAPRVQERDEQARLAVEHAGREEAERLAAEQAEAERLSREQVEREAAEHAGREEAERLAAEQAEAERLSRERAEREEAERMAGEQADIPPPTTGRPGRVQRLMPRRTRTRVLLLALILVVAGATIAAVTVLGEGDETAFGRTVQFTRVESSPASGSVYLVMPGDEEPDYVDVSVNWSGDRTARLEILLFNDMNKVKAFSKLPPNTKRLAGGVQPIYTGGGTEGFIYEQPNLPDNYRDYSYLGVASTQPGDPVHRLALYAPMDALLVP
jgi:CHAT domain